MPRKSLPAHPMPPSRPKPGRVCPWGFSILRIVRVGVSLSRSQRGHPVDSWLSLHGLFRDFARLAGLDRSDIDPGSPKIGCRKRLLRTKTLQRRLTADATKLDTRASTAAQKLSHYIKGENYEKARGIPPHLGACTKADRICSRRHTLAGWLAVVGRMQQGAGSCCPCYRAPGDGPGYAAPGPGSSSRYGTGTGSRPRAGPGSRARGGPSPSDTSDDRAAGCSSATSRS